MKKAFTLAEIMIVLSIIGILTAILLPVAISSAPDENIMKFKKANNTLGMVIRELINSDKYYADGDLGKKPDGTLVNSATYLCETIADVMSTKSVNCSEAEVNVDHGHLHIADVDGADNTGVEKAKADTMCKTYQRDEIVTSDGITYFQVDPKHHFATLYKTGTTRLYGVPGYWNDKATTNVDGTINPYHSGTNSFDLIYKIFCIDVDGINKGEDPFGYGIRADGKILPGARADEWIQKSVQNKD